MIREYKISMVIVDDTKKFKEEAHDMSEDLEVIPEDIMLVHIKKAVNRFSNFELFGVYVKDVKLEMELGGER